MGSYRYISLKESHCTDCENKFHEVTLSQQHIKYSYVRRAPAPLIFAAVSGHLTLNTWLPCVGSLLGLAWHARVSV